MSLEERVEKLEALMAMHAKYIEAIAEGLTQVNQEIDGVGVEIEKLGKTLDEINVSLRDIIDDKSDGEEWKL